LLWSKVLNIEFATINLIRTLEMFSNTAGGVGGGGTRFDGTASEGCLA
jgi:hypothetical protein